MTTIVIPTRYSFASSQRELLGMFSAMSMHETHVCSPRYGVFAVTRRSFELDGSPISVIHFWEGEIVNSDTGTVLKLGKSYYYEQMGNINLWAVSHSGTYVLLLVDAASSSDGAAYLGLLHFSSTQIPPITFRKLDIGFALTRLGSVSRMAIDDALGTVFLLNEKGNMSVIPYVGLIIVITSSTYLTQDGKNRETRTFWAESEYSETRPSTFLSRTCAAKL
ncbi:hypothetical protein B0H16DRAFT_1735828 [Mycena metata]|uniref:Uncharacterized protein n=1 Tax=Mycena metata TaxID=1033252 RepID=A0AAD7HS75_9AGAR|nr:hypothetical protein B0H16DRAFT_1735828 [Mycena metata]